MLALALVLALFAQDLNPSPRNLLHLTRPLTTAEVLTILKASREALSEKTLRVSSLSRGHVVDILMGRAGQPKMMRTS
jgi:hypothetical protein